MTKPKAGRYHWLKWWPRRWRGDPAVQACSLAARGAWNEILNVMHLEDSGGYLLIGGEVPDTETIARLLGCTEREWKAVESELERRKVFSRRATDGAIFCRSRVREDDDDGEPQGSPVGYPKGDPPGTSRGIPIEPEGSPPSRALSSSRPLSSPGGSSEGGSEPPDAYAPPRPDVRSRCLAMHPTLDTPAVREALDRWEGHLRERGKAPYTSRNWASNLAKWERWGPARLVAAIDATLCTTACTVFEPEHGERPAASAPAERSTRTPEQDAMWDLWAAKQQRRIDRGEIRGMPDYPGFDAARAELAASAQQPSMRLVPREQHA